MLLHTRQVMSCNCLCSAFLPHDAVCLSAVRFMAFPGHTHKFTYGCLRSYIDILNVKLNKEYPMLYFIFISYLTY